jgi:RNA polymerase sigma factor (sigma-70 family)
MVLSTVSESAPEGMVEDLAQDALVEALVAFEVAPPAQSHALPGWMATIARRTVADYLEKRTRRSQYEGEMPRVFDDAKLDESGPPRSPSDRPEPAVSAPVFDPREASDEDDAMQGARLFRWLEKQVEANPRDRETLQMILEHGRTDKTYDQIATEHGITLVALSSRIHEFKKKYTPRYRRERERAVLLLFLFGVALVALVLYLLSRPAPPPQRGQAAPPTPLIDRIFGGPLPVGSPPPDDGIQPDGGSLAPKE